LQTWNPSVSLRVAFQDCRSVGVDDTEQCRLQSDNRGAFVLNVVVDPLWRGRGIAQMLMGRAIKTAQASGAFKMYIEVDHGNNAAHGLYQKLGFHKSTRPGLYEPAKFRAVYIRALASLDSQSQQPANIFEAASRLFKSPLGFGPS
jgi:ribosomal protein S18 acetylase RimI-like enzyme